MKKIALFCLFFSAFLLGCTSNTNTNTTATDNKQRSMSMLFDDEDISYRAERRLAGDNDMKEQCHIVVATYNHVVLLVGEAPTEALKEKAYRIVKNGDPKIKKIYNLISIGQPTSGMTRSNDALITANVKARMVATTNLKANQFKVVTEDGVVYLMGVSTHEEANLVAEVVRNSTGVKKVVKVIEYTD